MRVVAIDYGKARIGVAVSDPTRTIATPLPTITSSGDPKKAALIVVKWLEQMRQQNNYIITQLVVGLPLLLSGKDSDTTTLVRKFIEELKLVTDIPIAAFDERLTTVLADRALRETNMTRKSRAQKVDAATATLLLQNYLALPTSSHLKP